jgi:hypothetical protein
LLVLIAASSAFWLLAALPARLLGGGNRAVAHSGTALLLCLVPTAATLAWAGWAFEQGPEQQVLVVLGGTGLRLFGVLAAGSALYYGVPYYREPAGFLTWLVVCYLFTLALEMVLLLGGRPTTRG